MLADKVYRAAIKMDARGGEVWFLSLVVSTLCAFATAQTGSGSILYKATFTATADSASPRSSAAINSSILIGLVT